jgi:hypothetical protein
MELERVLRAKVDTLLRMVKGSLIEIQALSQRIALIEQRLAVMEPRKDTLFRDDI